LLAIFEVAYPFLPSIIANSDFYGQSVSYTCFRKYI
jgi:hypothetical protein